MHIDFHTHAPFEGKGVFLDHYKLDQDIDAHMRKLVDDFHKAFPSPKIEAMPVIGVEISISMYFKARRRIPLVVQEQCWVVGSIHTYKGPDGNSDPNKFLEILDFYGDQIDHLAHPFQHELEGDISLGSGILKRFVEILEKHSLPTEFNQRHFRNNDSCHQFITYMLQHYPNGMLISTDSHHEMWPYKLLPGMIDAPNWKMLMDPERAERMIQARNNRVLMDVSQPIAILEKKTTDTDNFFS